METEFQRRAGRRRHLPGADLARLRRRREQDPRRARRRGARREGPAAAEPSHGRPVDDAGRADHRAARGRGAAGRGHDGGATGGTEPGATPPVATTPRPRRRRDAPAARPAAGTPGAGDHRRRHRDRRRRARDGADPPAGHTGADDGGDDRQAAPAGRVPRPAARARLARGVPQSRRPRPGDVAAAGGAEAPGQLDGLGDPDPRTREHGGALPARPRAGGSRIGPSNRLVSLSSRSMPSAWVSLPGAVAEVDVAGDAAARAHHARGPRAARARGCRTAAPTLAVLADRVEQRVDAVGAVDVGLARARRRGPTCAAVRPT